MARMRLWFGLCSLGLAVFVWAAPAQAVTTRWCIDCAEKGSQGKELRAALETLVHDRWSLDQMTQALKVAERNAKAFVGNFLAGPSSIILDIFRRVQEDRGMTVEAMSMMKEFDRQYPGYLEWLQYNEPESDFTAYEKLYRQNREAMATAMGRVDSARMDTLSEGEVIRQLQAEWKTTEGITQSIGMANKIALQQIKQNQRLQALLDTQIKLIGDVLLADNERDLALSEAIQDEEDEFNFKEAFGGLTKGGASAFDVKVEGLEGQSGSGQLHRP